MSPLGALGRAPAGRPALHLEPGGAEDRVLTYGELHDLVRRRADALRPVRRPTERTTGPALLAVARHPAASQLVEVLAALEAGLAVLPVNAAWWPRERDAVFEQLRPTLVSGREGPGHPAEPTGLPPRAHATGRDDAGPGPGGARLWLASVGTDGDPTPYGFRHDQVSAWLTPRAGDGEGALEPAPGERVAVTGELGHAPVLRAALGALAAGAELQLTDRAHIAELLAHAGWDLVVTTPVLLRRALRQLHRRGRRPAGAGRLVVHQGPVRPHERLVWSELFGGSVHDRVSATETGGWLLADGVTEPGITVRLDATGAVHTAGDGSAVASTAGARPDGGWPSGDVAEPAPDGTLRWRGRRRDRFVADGAEVDPVEVEAVLAAHPLVAEVAIAPRPHPERSNVVVAVLVPSDPEWPPFLEDLAELTAGLPAHARPEALAIVEDLPVNAAGALHRRLVNYEEASR